MKEIRPSTWVVLGVMMLLIFAPVFFIDVDDINVPRGNQQHDPNLKPHIPSAPFNRPSGPYLPDDSAPDDEKAPEENPPPAVPPEEVPPEEAPPVQPAE